ncbi:MAG: hypothetical protein ACI9BD_001094 [Candidatus Marinamargulisbacteria bacterium]|jgi:hypothetical protein
MGKSPILRPPVAEFMKFGSKSFDNEIARRNKKARTGADLCTEAYHNWSAKRRLETEHQLPHHRLYQKIWVFEKEHRKQMGPSINKRRI